METLKLLIDEAVFVRRDDFVVFNQLGLKMEIGTDIDDETYYRWLDDMIGTIGTLVRGAEIVEKEYARTEPRLNTGVYYDGANRPLLRLGAVLRTTCNKKTHAFCAFKKPVDERGVRRDHRHVFQGDDKTTIQNAPLSPEAVAIVKRLLSRNDIEHPGTHLASSYGISASDLSPSICIEQYRHPFYVWLDKRDALRCTMDRAYVTDLRATQGSGERKMFAEIELPVYPRISPDVAGDPRLVELIDVLRESLASRFGATLTKWNKYQRAALTLGIM